MTTKLNQFIWNMNMFIFSILFFFISLRFYSIDLCENGWGWWFFFIVVVIAIPLPSLEQRKPWINTIILIIAKYILLANVVICHRLFIFLFVFDTQIKCIHLYYLYILFDFVFGQQQLKQWTIKIKMCAMPVCKHIHSYNAICDSISSAKCN